MQGFKSRAAVSGSKYANHCARMPPSQMCYFHSLKQSRSYLQTKTNQKTKNAADLKPQILQFFQKSTFRDFFGKKPGGQISEPEFLGPFKMQPDVKMHKTYFLPLASGGEDLNGSKS